MFTDLVESTSRRVRVGDDEYDRFIGEHVRVTTRTVERSGGRVVKFTGDGVMAVFASASDALDAAVGCQVDGQGLQSWAAGSLLRVGLSVGDVVIGDDDPQGTPVVEAARLCSAAQPGQILCSTRW